MRFYAINYVCIIFKYLTFLYTTQFDVQKLVIKIKTTAVKEAKDFELDLFF